MAIVTLRATTLYEDWKGTVAASGPLDGAIQEYLEKGKLIEEDELVIAASFYMEEGNGSLRVFVMKENPVFPSLSAAIEASAPKPLPTRVLVLQTSLEEFTALFQRFSIVLTLGDQNLEGRQVSTN